MKKGLKKLTVWLIAGGAVIALGVVLLIIGLSLGGANPNVEFTEEVYVQKSADINFISLDCAGEDLDVIFYDGENIEITYWNSKVNYGEIKEMRSTLKYDRRSRMFVNMFRLEIPKTVVKLPSSGGYNIEVDLSIGNATIAGGNYGNIKLDISAGKITFSGDISCGLLETDISTGTLYAQNIRCSAFKADLSAGKTETGFITCNNAEIDMSTGSFASAGISTASLAADVNAGAVRIERCECPLLELDISTGNIELNIPDEKSQYNILLERYAGSCNVSNQRGTDPDKRIYADVSSGTLSISFTG